MIFNKPKKPTHKENDYRYKKVFAWRPTEVIDYKCEINIYFAERFRTVWLQYYYTLCRYDCDSSTAKYHWKHLSNSLEIPINHRDGLEYEKI